MGSSKAFEPFFKQERGHLGNVQISEQHEPSFVAVWCNTLSMVLACGCVITRGMRIVKFQIKWSSKQIVFNNGQKAECYSTAMNVNQYFELGPGSWNYFLLLVELHEIYVCDFFTVTSNLVRLKLTIIFGYMNY